MFLLKNPGVLGINARNLLYIRAYNKKKAIRLADSKLQTKHFLSARGVPVPKLFFSIKNRGELEKFDFSSLPSSFVLKPNYGFGGEGIIPIVGKDGGFWLKPSGEKLSNDDLYDHIGDILDGRFSISNIADIAFFEQRIVCDDVIDKYSYGGLPDIRIVVYNLIPVLAMLRLPTRESDGKGNLHQGAVGVGIDIAKGEATHIVRGSKIINEVPEVGDIRKLKIPYWDDILLTSSKIQLLTNLGYLAVDIAIDRVSGPVLLEINARAGLAVQIANLVPLRNRLERVKGVKVSNPEKGVRIAKDMFGDQIERDVKHLSGKQVIGCEENLELILKDRIIKSTAQIDSLSEVTVMDTEYAKKIMLLKGDDKAKSMKMSLVLGGHRIKTLVEFEDLKDEKHSIIVGRRDLGYFYIDSSRTLKKTSLPSLEKGLKDEKVNWMELDRALTDIDKQIKLLYHLKPINLEEEKIKFKKDKKYNPQFKYRDLSFNPYELKKRLNGFKINECAIGILFSDKRDEIFNKIKLLESIGSDYFTENSIRLFGSPSGSLVWEAEKLIEKDDFSSKEILDVSADQARDIFEEVFASYGLHGWSVKMKKDMVTNCVAGKNNVLFLKDGSVFSRHKLNSLIAHEIETHILTAENGKKQPYLLFNRGLANYLITQEGLAIYNQETRFPSNRRKFLVTAMAVYYGIKMSFCELFEKISKIGLSFEESFQICLKIKRGLEDSSQNGGFTKDYVYFKGFKEIETFVSQGGDLKKLYIGKLNHNDIDLLDRIDGIVKASYLPKWM